MSNAHYMGQVEAMFDRFDRQLNEIGKSYASNMLYYLLWATPGPGNQNPPDTQYIPTGTLRQRWDLTTEAAPAETDDWTQDNPGDLSTDGRSTAQRLSDELAAIPKVNRLTVFNTCAYGYLVHEGLGRHAEPRKFTLWAVDPTRAQGYLDQAVTEVMSRG